jgi:selenocysteine lyase/cysteine desulfurase
LSESSEEVLLATVGANQTVPIVTGGAIRYVNLDIAASSPSLETVWTTVQELMPWYSSVHRGAGFPSRVMTDVLESARHGVITFLNAPADSSVVFTRNTTDAINLLSVALPEDTFVISYASEHHANLLPWRDHRGEVIPIMSSPADVLEATARALKNAPPGPTLLAVTGASNVTGEVWPVAELVQLAHSRGARVLVDGAQLVPHRAVDLAALGADFLAFSGHKIYAPFGAGALVGRADWLDAAPPYLQGGGAVNRVTMDDVTWLSGPARHEAGTPNLIGIAALAASCNTLGDVGMERVSSHEAALLRRLLEGLGDIPSVTVYSAWPAENDRVGVVSFNIDEFAHSQVAAILSAEYAIGVRDGSFCAHPFVDRLTARAERASGAVRASIGVGTDGVDIERFLDALSQIVSEGPRWAYEVVGGRYVPSPDPRPRPRFPNVNF